MNNLIDQIDEAYSKLKTARTKLHEIECVVSTMKEIAVENNFEELKGARSIEARNQAIAFFLKRDQEYEQARDDLQSARLDFELAKDDVDRVKLLAQLES